MAIVPYIECDAEGANSRRALCSESGVKGYPTWQLDGQLFPGATPYTCIQTGIISPHELLHV